MARKPTTPGKRTGAQRIAEIPADVLAQLNRGALETASLAEGLAVDYEVLLSVVAPELSATAVKQVLQQKGIVKRNLAAGEVLAEEFGPDGVARFARHRSDVVRGWGAFLIAALPGLSLKRRLGLIRPLADDPHFGVREWAWLALRPHLAAQLDQSLTLLTPWTKHKSENVRRFASESTRPRGVWCAHIAQLKEQPRLGLPLLEPLRADRARYVQNSVANWLNDAAKSQPEWVCELCARWEEESPLPATRYICQRACRSLRPKRTGHKRNKHSR